jgi:hypothetical protein
MKNFSSPTNLHKPPLRPKALKKSGRVEDSGTSNLSKKISQPNNNALVHRIERYKTFLCRVVDHVLLGHLGEWLLHAYLQAQGWHKVQFSSEKRRGDVSGVHPATGEIIRFEVKVARRGSQKAWQFCLNKPNKTACSHSDFVFLIVIDGNGAIYHYLVPSAFFGRISKFTLSSHPTAYKGKLAAFRLRSETIDIIQSQEIYQLGAKQS